MIKYQCLLADPAWPYNLRRNGKTRFGLGMHGHYPPMKVKDILALPVQSIVEDRSVLFLWVPGPFMKQGIQCVEAWGFEFCTVAFTWLKLTTEGDFWGGPGHYTLSNQEYVLLGRKGKYIRPAKMFKQPIKTYGHTRDPKSGGLEHSEKPAEIQARIEQMYPQLSKVELFARRPRQNWTVIGNEIDGRDIRDILKEVA